MNRFFVLGCIASTIILATAFGDEFKLTPDQEKARSLRGVASNIQYTREGNVRFLRFSKPIVNDEHIAKIVMFDQLNYLAIVTKAVSAAGLQPIAKCKNLDTLVLADSNLTDEAMESLAGLTKLKHLFLDDTAITDTSIAHLSSLTELQTLSLQGTNVSDKGLASILEMKELEVLNLSYTKITDAGLRQLAALPELKVLMVDGVSITGAGFENFGQLTKLESVSIAGTAVTADSLQSLQDCKFLRQLDLTKTNVTPADTTFLTDKRRKLNISFSAVEGRKRSALARFRAGELQRTTKESDSPTTEIATSEIAEPIALRMKKTSETPDFQKHVVPLLGRLGCNGRACHGSFKGQGGFRLSMFGYDFASDHEALTKGEEPRVNIEEPDKSLIVFKPTNELEHEGGQRYEIGSWEHTLLKRWIAAGANGPADEPRTMIGFEVLPAEFTFSKVGQTLQLKCISTWSDGSREDVTALTRFQSNDEVVAEVTADGLVTCKSPGDTHVISYYDNGVFPTQFILPMTKLTGDRFPKIETPTEIDRFVLKKLSKLGVVPSEVCSDEDFLRRVSLDIAGTLPTPDEVEAFLADSSVDKRKRKIDELLERPAYADWWGMQLSDLTGSNAQYLGGTDMNSPAATQWNQWLRQRVADNTPWDEIAAGIILAHSRRPDQRFDDYAAEQSMFLKKKSPTDYNAADNPMHYYWFRSNNQTPTDRALSFGYVFLGVRLQCAQCHKHPFDRWSKQDFEQFTEFFSRVKVGVSPQSRDRQFHLKKKLGVPAELDTAALRRQMYMRVAAEGLPIPWNEIFIEPTRDKPHIAKLLGDNAIDLNEFEDPREPLMAWLTRKDNPYFARAIVNRVWRRYFGVGIVEPPDDFNTANPPSNAELLTWLNDQFIAHDYDLKWLHRTIANSRTYQTSWLPNETNRLDDRNFSHARVRRLPAEVAIDAILQSTVNTAKQKQWASSTERKIAQHPKSIQSRGVDFSLLVFGKPLRTTNCDCERQTQPTLLQSLYVRNDHELLQWLERPDGWLQQIAREYKVKLSPETTVAKKVKEPDDDAQPTNEATRTTLIKRAYLRTVNRQPTAEEQEIASKHLTASENIAEGMRDLLWALINTQEFLTNH